MCIPFFLRTSVQHPSDWNLFTHGSSGHWKTDPQLFPLTNIFNLVDCIFQPSSHFHVSAYSPHFSMLCNIPLSSLFPRNAKNSMIQPSAHISAWGRRLSSLLIWATESFGSSAALFFQLSSSSWPDFFYTHWKLTCSKVCYGVVGWRQGLKKAQRQNSILELRVAMNLRRKTSLTISLCARYQASCWK